jgi:SAM-dependent methyltransferase
MEVVRKPYHFLKYRVWGNLRRATDFRVARRELARSTALREHERRLLADVSVRTALDDGMYAGSASDYLRVGLSALQAIEIALGESAKPIADVRSILDFPSGYGRVLRFLKVRFPAAAITVSEIDGRALEFCRRAFSVRAAPSRARFRDLEDVGRFDLVWCGSLITHVDRDATADLLGFFRRQLRPGGVCVVTTHGPRSAAWIEDRTETYRLTPAAQRDLLAQFRGGGYGYVDYEGRRGYGVSIISRPRLLEIAAGVGNWRNACYLEHGWAEHQDVHAFVADGAEL